MRILPPVEEKIRREIRDARAKDPLVSVDALQDMLEKKLGRTFRRKYISRLAGKVARQALIEVNRTQIEQRMAVTRENYRMMREQLLKIVYWKDGDGGKRPWHSEVTDAAKTVVMLDLALLRARDRDRHIQEADRRLGKRNSIRAATARRSRHHSPKLAQFCNAFRCHHRADGA
jgi:hypothetical protein